MFILRQSTAVDVLIGPFVDKTDGVTAEASESPVVKLSKNGQALAAKNDVTTPVHDADGYYNCQFDTTDTNTVGSLVLTVAASANAAPVRHEFQVIEEAAYDLMYASGATGQVVLAASQTNKVTFADGIVVNKTTANEPALDLNGNGSGAGIDATGGATGAGIKATGGSTSGNGIDAAANGSGDGIEATGAGSGHGIAADGGTAGGNGALLQAGAGSTGDGLRLNASTLGGQGLTVNGVATNSTAALFQGKGTGHALQLVVATGNPIDYNSTDLLAAVRAEIDANSTQLSAILTDTAEIGAAGAGLTALASASALATVDANVDAILVDTGTTLPATLATAAALATVDATVDAILVDTGTTIPGILGTPAGADMSADIATVDSNVDGVKAVTDALTAAAAAKLASSMLGVITGTATGGTTGTVTSALTGEGDDTFNGRLLVFTSGALRYEAGIITDYDSTAGTFTFAASTWTTSPTTETFIIL